MRASNHKGRTKNSGAVYDVNHNDRNFESKKDKHIDKAKSADNIYLFVDGDGEISERKDKSFREHEQRRYTELFFDSLYRKNEKAIAQRHAERVKSIEDYLDGKKTCPEEEILQIGKEGEYQDIEKFRECVEEYIKRHQERFPDIKILDAAIHVDETSLHCHLRKVYCAPDKEGDLEAKQHQCLKNLGYTLPDPEKSRGQFNNLKIPYTEDTRAMWLDICEEKNRDISLERVPDKNNLGVELAEYKRQKTIEKLEKGEKILEFQRGQVTANNNTIEKQKEQIGALNGEIEQKNGIIQKLKEMIESFNRQIESFKAKIKELTEKLTKIQADKEKAENELSDAKSKVSELERERDKLQAENKKLLEEANRMPAKEIEGKKALGGGIKLSEEEFATLKSKAKAYDKNKSKIAKGDSYIKQAQEIKRTAEVEAEAIVKNATSFEAGLNRRLQNSKAEDKTAEVEASLDFAEKFIDSLGAGARYRAAINAKRAEKMTAVTEVDVIAR